jgi:hypothetical protein
VNALDPRLSDLLDEGKRLPWWYGDFDAFRDGEEEDVEEVVEGSFVGAKDHFAVDAAAWIAEKAATSLHSSLLFQFTPHFVNRTLLFNDLWE